MKLKDTLTVHFISFELPENFDCKKNLDQGNELWEPSTPRFDGSCLLPSIVKFFNNSSQCKVYMLHKDGYPHSMFWGNAESNISAKDEKGIDLNYTYKFPVKRNLSAPMLYIFPECRIGILSIGIQLVKVDTKSEIDSSDLMWFNYKMSHFTKKWNPLNICIEKAIFKDINGFLENSPNVKELSALLLYCAGLGSVEIENKSHLFTYAQFDVKGPAYRHWPPMETLMRLIRVQNENYQVSQEEIEAGYFLRTFENIIQGVSVEGGGIFTCYHGENNTPHHIKNYLTGAILPRYLWIYIISIVQRKMAISLTSQMASNEMIELLKGKVETPLYREYERLNLLKLYAYFPDVSNISQMNAFYSLCVKNFNIKEYVENIDDKMRSIRSILERRQDLYERRQDKEEWKLEKQRDLEESRRYQESKMLREQENAKERRNEKHLNYIILGLTFLTIISVVNDFASYIKLYYEYDICDWVWAPILSAVLGLVFFLVGLICFMRINMKTKGDVETYKNNKDKHK